MVEPDDRCSQQGNRGWPGLPAEGRPEPFRDRVVSLDHYPAGAYHQTTRLHTFVWVGVWDCASYDLCVLNDIPTEAPEPYVHRAWMASRGKRAGASEAAIKETTASLRLAEVVAGK